MKLPAILLVTISTLLLSCGLSSTANDVIGTYVVDFKNEFTITSDTVIISAYSKDLNLYQIDRRTGFNRIRGGKMLLKEYKKKLWKATYNQDTHNLAENQFDLQIRYVPDKRLVLLGNTEYRKIK